MSAHAKLSPSSSDRWMNCPGSVAASVGIEDVGSVFAAEGSAAHALAAWCLQHGLSPVRFAGKAVDGRIHEGNPVVSADLADGRYIFAVTDEMVEGVDLYVDYCRSLCEPGDDWAVEQRVIVSDDVWGTADFRRYRPSTGHLAVVDFKYGRGVAVEPKNNPQALTYAVGAVKALHNRGVGDVLVAIVQPRCPHPDGSIREWHTDAVELLDFETDLARAVERTKRPDAPRAAGEWCQFCPAAGICPALRQRAMAAAANDFAAIATDNLNPAGYDPAKLAQALADVDLVEDWCRRVRDFAHHEAEAGRMPPGWKLVATRATRKWRDPAGVADELALDLGMAPEHLYAEPKLLSPAQVEAQLKAHYGLKGQAAKAALKTYASAISGGTVLAPVDDPRPSVRASAEDDFSQANG